MTPRIGLNRLKHGVSFALAQAVFFDPHGVIAEDLDHSGTEPHYFCFGTVAGRRDDGALYLARQPYPHFRRRLLAKGKDKSMSNRTVRYTAGEIGRVRVDRGFPACARRPRAARRERQGDALVVTPQPGLSSSAKPRSAACRISA